MNIRQRPKYELLSGSKFVPVVLSCLGYIGIPFGLQLFDIGARSELNEV